MKAISPRTMYYVNVSLVRVMYRMMCHAAKGSTSGMIPLLHGNDGFF